MAPPNKVVSHPQKELIIKWIMEGIPSREIERRLYQKYSSQSQAHLRVSATSIQDFKKNFVDLKGQIAKDVSDATRETGYWSYRNQVEQEVQKTSAYKEAITSLAEQELDARKEILEISILIKNRLRVFYDTLSESEHLDERNEKVLQTYMDKALQVIEKYEKLVNGFKENADTNINITVVNEQVGILRDAVRDTLADVEPSLAIEFMERLNMRMKELKYEGSEDKNDKERTGMVVYKAD